MADNQPKEQKPTKTKRASIPLTHFVEIWEGCKSQEEVAAKTGLTIQSVYMRGNKINKQLKESPEAVKLGFVLKKLPRSVNSRSASIPTLLKFLGEKNMLPKTQG